MLRKMEGKGRYETAKRLRSTCSQIFRYAQDQMTGHGFHAMAATLLNEVGLWHADAIQRQLAHCDNNAVRRAYTRGEYWASASA